MLKKRSSNTKKPSDIKEPSLRSRWLWAGLCALLAALFIISFADYVPAQNPNNFSPESNNVQPNAIGLFGIQSSIYGFYILGGAAWLIPILFAWRAWLFLRKVRQGTWTIFIAMIFCAISAAVLLAIQNLIFLNLVIAVLRRIEGRKKYTLLIKKTKQSHYFYIPGDNCYNKIEWGQPFVLFVNLKNKIFIIHADLNLDKRNNNISNKTSKSCCIKKNKCRGGKGVFWDYKPTIFAKV